MNPLAPDRKIQLRLQPDGSEQCGQACAAMLADVTVADACKALRKWTGTHFDDMKLLLKRYGFTIPTRPKTGSPVWPVAIVCIEDKAVQRDRHFVLLFHGAWYCPSNGINPAYMGSKTLRIVFNIPILKWKDQDCPPTHVVERTPEQPTKGPNGRNLCRCGCGKEAPPPRRNWFSQQCVDNWRMQHDWGVIRSNVLARDKGVCAKCSRDCVGIVQAAWRLWHEVDRTEYHALLERNPGLDKYRDYWECDHILERHLGGTNAMDNLQTLCVPCHKEKTAAFNRNKHQAQAPAA